MLVASDNAIVANYKDNASFFLYFLYR